MDEIHIKKTDDTDNHKNMNADRKQRLQNTIIAMIHIFAFGLEFESIVVSLLYYLQKDVSSIKNAHMWYGLIMAFQLLSASISGIVFGKVVDRTRNVKLVLMFIITLSVIGNLLYTISYSVWILAVGRFLTGTAEALHPIMCGEFTRMYSETEVTGVVSKFQIFFGIGYTIGPASGALFKGVDITIINGIWRITERNAIGGAMAILHVFVGFLVIFGYKNNEGKNDNCNKVNIHKDEDKYFKESNGSNYKVLEDDCQAIEEDDIKDIVEIDVKKPTADESNEPPSLLSWRDLLQIDILVLIVSTSLTEACSSTLELIVNMTANTTFGWSLREIFIVSSIAVVISYIFITFVVYKNWYNGAYRVYVGYMVCLLTQACMLSVAIIPYVVTISNIWIERVYFVSLIGLTCFTYFSLMSVAKLLLFQIVPSHSSCFADGVRTSLSTGLSVFGYVFSSFIFFHGDFIFPPLVLILLLFFVILIIRRRNYYDDMNK